MKAPARKKWKQIKGKIPVSGGSSQRASRDGG